MRALSGWVGEWVSGGGAGGVAGEVRWSEGKESELGKDEGRRSGASGASGAERRDGKRRGEERRGEVR